MLFFVFVEVVSVLNKGKKRNFSLYDACPSAVLSKINMDKTIYLTRHCEAQHNVSGDYQIPDAVLTKKGRQQAKDLDRATRETVQKDVELIVSSPLR